MCIPTLKRVLVGLLLIGSLSVNAWGADYYVDALNGDDGNDGLSWGAAKQTIGAAMGLIATNTGNVVHVAAGTYNEKVTFPQRPMIELLGGYPAGGGERNPWSNATIIDGTGVVDDGAMVVIPYRGDAGNLGWYGMVVDGFQIRNGTTSYVQGAAITAYTAGVAIRNNVIENNTASNGYGAIYIYRNYGDSSRISYVQENIVRSNTGAYVGGIALEGGPEDYFGYADARFENNLIVDNHATGSGTWGVAGMDLMTTSKVTVLNCTIANNTVTGSPTTAIDGIRCAYDGDFYIINSIVWHPAGDDILVVGGSLTVSYSDIHDAGDTGTGVIHSDPSFAGASDYHLDGGSPCIDTGTNGAAGLPSTDLDGELRTLDGDGNGSAVVDMGAYEYPEGSGEVVPTDFDADGIPDILWRNPSTGANALWFMQSNGSSIKSAGGMPSCGTSWSIAGVDDFDADGVPDILWRNSLGHDALWYLNAGGNSIKAAGGVPSCGTSWSVAGVADFDADGIPDILWRNTLGHNALWYMDSDGASIKAAGGVPSCGTSWQAVGVADFDADGVPDIMWRNALGHNALWYMQSNGSSIKSAGGMPSCGTSWQVGKVADFDADGVPDIFWRNQSTGVNALWYMQDDGASIKAAGGAPSCGTSWEIGG